MPQNNTLLNHKAHNISLILSNHDIVHRTAIKEVLTILKLENIFLSIAYEKKAIYLAIEVYVF